MSTVAILAGLAIALVGLVPVRRLQLAGWKPGRLAAYWTLLLVLGFLVAEVRGPARLLVPAFLVVYLAPFVTFRAGVARLAGRGQGESVSARPPTRTVGSSGYDDADDGDGRTQSAD